MRSALFRLSIQAGCCRSREPTVWSQLIAGSVSARRASVGTPRRFTPDAKKHRIFLEARIRKRFDRKRDCLAQLARFQAGLQPRSFRKTSRNRILERLLFVE